MHDMSSPTLEQSLTKQSCCNCCCCCFGTRSRPEPEYERYCRYSQHRPGDSLLLCTSFNLTLVLNELVKAGYLHPLRSNSSSERVCFLFALFVKKSKFTILLLIMVKCVCCALVSHSPLLVRLACVRPQWSAEASSGLMPSVFHCNCLKM